MSVVATSLSGHRAVEGSGADDAPAPRVAEAPAEHPAPAPVAPERSSAPAPDADLRLHEPPEPPDFATVRARDSGRSDLHVVPGEDDGAA